MTVMSVLWVPEGVGLMRQGVYQYHGTGNYPEDKKVFLSP